MSEEIIIDGVNVTECEHYTTMEDCDGIHDLCEQIDDYCSIKKNCYYKQLQRLKQENEELKEKINKFQWDNPYYILYENVVTQRDKYKQALEEIRNIVKPIKDNTCFGMNCGAVDWILDEINEVLND